MSQKAGVTPSDRNQTQRARLPQAESSAPELSSGRQVAQLQRVIGNHATVQLVNTHKANLSANGTIQRDEFGDIDSTQYRISGPASSRKIELVERRKEKGAVVYYALGEVTGFSKDKRPIVAKYPKPISLGDWFPGVTHINGMAVAPESGINSAVALQESVNEALGTSTDAAVDQDAIDVLYTYSAQRGGLVSDVWDCLKGKVSLRDDATVKQEEIMLDAVDRQKRVTVSAHSRGTIKTDNAVRKVVKILTERHIPAIHKANYDTLMQQFGNMDMGMGITGADLVEMHIRYLAEKLAKEEMDRYIQLIYAGNAVSYPSSALKPTLFVGGMDFVSMTVGSYTKLISGAKSVGAFKGHGFTKNYVKHVGSAIAKDIKGR